MTTNTPDPLRHDLDQLSKAGASVVAIAQALGHLEADADAADPRAVWNTPDVRGGLLLAIEQIGARVDSLSNALAARLPS